MQRHKHIPQRAKDKTAVFLKVGPEPVTPKARKLLEVLTDDIFVGKLKDMLFLATIMEKLEEMIQRFDSQSAESVILKEKVAELEAKVSSLEDEIDWLEQYSHRSNIRIQGPPKPVMEKTL